MFYYDYNFTVRKCIEKMRRVNTRTIYLYNGTKIVLLEMNADKYECIGKFKWNKDGTCIMRKILCQIIPNARTIGMDTLKQKYWMYDPNDNGLQFFDDDDFLIPERAMNEFICDNGGIDEYQTISCPYYMMVDTLSMLNDFQ